MLASATHNTGAMIFLFFTVGLPFVIIVGGALCGRYDNPKRNERAGYVENKIERYRSRGQL